MKKNIFFLFLMFTALGVVAQPPQAATCSSTVKMLDDIHGELIITITPNIGWHIYGPDIAKGGPKPLQFDASTSTGVSLDGDFTPSSKPQSHFDETFSMDVTYWTGKVILTQKFTITDKSNAAVSGFVRYQGCNNETCSPPKKFRFNHSIN